MSTPQLLMTQDADSAASRYGMLVEGWRALYSAALDQSHFGTPKQVAEVTVQAYSLAGAYLSNEAERIAADTLEYALEAQRVTFEQLSIDDTQEIAGSTGEHLSALNDYLLHEITVQIERDIAFLRQSLRETYLHVAMAARANSLPLRTALIQYRIGNAAELNFVFRDRGSQRWPSRRFVRAVWRQHLVSVYNETVLITLSDHSVDTAQITHTDINSPHHGTLLSIDSNSELPTYAELKPTVFHPNSEAILGRAA